MGPRPREHAHEGRSRAAEHSDVGSTAVSSKWSPLVLIVSFTLKGVVAVGQAEALHVQPSSSAAKPADVSYIVGIRC